MRSLIAEPGRSGDPIKIRALSREPGNPGWTAWTRAIYKLFMGDLDHNQFQPNLLHDIVNDTVAPSGVENEAYHGNNNVHRMNNREWTDQQKHRIVEIDKEERTRGKHFMKRVKERWDTEFPTVVRTAQNLIDNAKRFQKEGWGRSTVENGEVAAAQIPHPKDQKKRSLEWTTEMKVALITFDNEERAKGRGFMKRVKERWDQYFPEYRHASWQKLRDNAARFKKEPEVMNLILVRRRNEI